MLLGWLTEPARLVCCTPILVQSSRMSNVRRCGEAGFVFIYNLEVAHLPYLARLGVTTLPLGFDFMSDASRQGPNDRGDSNKRINLKEDFLRVLYHELRNR